MRCAKPQAIDASQLEHFTNDDKEVPLMRLLWLIYERPPHPDAVCHPATEEETDFVLAMLRRPYRERTRLTAQLITYLNRQDRPASPHRRAIVCRTPSGPYRCVPWRLAKWLRHALPATESATADAIARIEHWQRQPAREFHSVAATR